MPAQIGVHQATVRLQGAGYGYGRDQAAKKAADACVDEDTGERIVLGTPTGSSGSTKDNPAGLLPENDDDLPGTPFFKSGFTNFATDCLAKHCFDGQLVLVTRPEPPSIAIPKGLKPPKGSTAKDIMQHLALAQSEAQREGARSSRDKKAALVHANLGA